MTEDNKNRIILHSDLNCFYASVETVLHPEYRGKAMAVCGDTELRHGIVLAKTEEAKRAGIKTGMPNHQAKSLCPELLIVRPNHDTYEKFSRLVRKIYERYTDKVESFGIDECWLDVTDNVKSIEMAVPLADEIRRAVKEELGLTVSIGVSFNKIFAKLGSDIKKPDAVTMISYDNYKDIVWRLPVTDMMGVGPSSAKRLRMMNIHTIGELAASDLKWIKYNLGKSGEMIRAYARGEDCSPVTSKDYVAPMKSVGHGHTAPRDLVNDDEVKCMIIELSQEIGYRLRKNKKTAAGISVSIRDDMLFTKEWQRKLESPTASTEKISGAAFELFTERYSWERPIRSVTVRAIDLADSDSPKQIDLFTDYESIEKERSLDSVIDEIRTCYGNKAIRNAVLIDKDFLNDAP